MGEIKFTKNELRAQQSRLQQLEKYLPTLQLKKAMLQAQVNEARLEIVGFEEAFQQVKNQVEGFSALLAENLSFNIQESVKVDQIKRGYENIAGVEVPYFESISFVDFHYDLFDTPPWVDGATKGLRGLVAAQVKVQIAREKKAALEKEWREVSIRVNLFEKVLIPRSVKNIKRIKVFLGDMQLAAVSQAKVAKSKIENRTQIQ